MIQSIADASRKYKTHGSEIKDLTTHSTEGIMNFMFSSLLPIGPIGSKWMTHMKQICVTDKEIQAQGTLIFYKRLRANLPSLHSEETVLESKQIVPLLQRGTLSLSSQDVCYTNILERQSRTKDSPEVSASVYKYFSYRNVLHKCKRSIGNYFPTPLRWRARQECSPSPL